MIESVATGTMPSVRLIQYAPSRRRMELAITRPRRRPGCAEAVFMHWFPMGLKAAHVGTVKPPARSDRMTDTNLLPTLVENSLQIAWDFLDGVGEIDDRQRTAEFLLQNIKTQILRGEGRALLLSNRAIESFRRRPLLVS